MSDIAISVENLSKSYLLGHKTTNSKQYTALRDVVANNARNLARKTLDLFQGKGIVQGDEVEEFWALKDLSFEIKKGERVGIIGRNGAGKSTLLKILSRITEPTAGRIKINGRVDSLLEVGTGFHPELTGRENIFLNGAILGMSKKEILRKFDEIVEFAEVERFLDTPVKRYSSGMYVRLAFAVSAHLEPEILIVDEVLAVGDVQFQAKCLGKMDDISKQGRTVIFVSHNLAAVRQLCTSGILLNSGRITYQGDNESTIAKLIDTVSLETSYSNKIYQHTKGDLRAIIEKITTSDSLKNKKNFSVYEAIEFNIKYRIIKQINEMEMFVLIHSLDGEVLLSVFQKDSGVILRPNGKFGIVNLKIINYLAPGRYLISAGIFDGQRDFVDWVEFAETLVIESNFNDGKVYDSRLGKTTQNGIWITKHAEL